MNTTSSICTEENMLFDAEALFAGRWGQKGDAEIVPLRTVTDFAFETERSEPIIPSEGPQTSRIWLTGRFASLDLNTNDGQKTSMGHWETLDQVIPGKVPLKALDLRRAAWFRGGGEVVLVAVGERSLYVLQQPKAAYTDHWRQSDFFPRHRFKLVKCTSTKGPPGWVNPLVWDAVVEWNRQHPAGPLPAVTESLLPSQANDNVMTTSTQVLEIGVANTGPAAAPLSPQDADAVGELDLDAGESMLWKLLQFPSPTPPLDPSLQFINRQLDL